MQFGVQFFPDVKPEEKSAAEYFRDSLEIVAASEKLGYSHVRIVEHYFHYYGGYSPNPIVFLAAAAALTKTSRLITGAVLPVFNNPLKLAGEIGMLDGISNGRLDVGFARAFLPHEFRRFGISPNESVARFREGLEQIDLLLREEHVTHHGRFHDIVDVTSLPRPTQKPRPKFYVAVSGTPESFEFAGSQGYAIMCIPMAADTLRDLLVAYRSAWRAAGHPGNGEVMMAFSMFVDEDPARARRIAGPRIEAYLHSLVDAASDWADGLVSKDYIGYDKMVESLRKQTMESQIASGSAWIGTPAELRATIARMQDEFGGFEHASLQINFNTMPQDEAMRSLALFATEVMPHFVPALATAGHGNGQP
jgi:alkanesulfonate monooxygenase SsuD/methylene tetrahydromethanopterin reductase-like flavin-dependent oxidoreductase (luciferase family)